MNTNSSLRQNVSDLKEQQDCLGETKKNGANEAARKINIIENRKASK